MRITPLVASTFFSDGGSMFGLVPRPIWSRKIPPDDRNRIAQHAHALLVELEDGRRGLVDTGCGSADRFDERERDQHGLGPGWPLLDALSRLGLSPEDINVLVFTHLHWDHAGGALAPPHAKEALSFPRADVFVHEYEWEDAHSGNPLLYKSYPPDIREGLSRLPPERLHRVTDRDAVVAPGFRLLRSSGHTRGHSVAVFEGDQVEIVGAPDSMRRPGLAVFAGDVCPTQHHLRMVFQTSYDTFPLDTRAWKRHWLPRLAAENGVLLFDHDPDLFAARIRADDRTEFAVVETYPAPRPS